MTSNAKFDPTTALLNRLLSGLAAPTTASLRLQEHTNSLTLALKGPVTRLPTQADITADSYRERNPPPSTSLQKKRDSKSHHGSG